MGLAAKQSQAVYRAYVRVLSCLLVVASWKSSGPLTNFQSKSHLVNSRNISVNLVAVTFSSFVKMYIS